MRLPWYFWSFVIAGLVAACFFAVSYHRGRDVHDLPPADLHSADPGIRVYAMRRLAGQLTFEQLRERIDNDEDGDVRLLAAMELCGRKHYRDIALLLGDRHEGIRREAAGVLGGAHQFELVKDALVHNDPRMRIGGLRALSPPGRDKGWRNWNDEHHDELAEIARRLANDDPDPEVRAAAKDALDAKGRIRRRP